MIKGSIYQEDIRICICTKTKVYAPNKRASKYRKQNLIELKEIEKSTILVGDFNTLLSAICSTVVL